MTYWIDCVLNDYFEAVPMERVSYQHFLNSSSSKVVNHCTGQTNFTDLDSILYKEFKAKVSHNAPRSATRRFTTEKLWARIKAACLEDEYQREKDQLAQQYKNDCLTLMEEAREIVADDVGQSLNGPGNSRYNNSSNKRKTIHKDKGKERARSQISSEADDLFLDRTPAEHIRSSILKYRIQADHVSDVHKQDLLYYGILDLTPSSSTKFRDHMTKECADEVTSLAKRHPKRKNDHANDVKHYVATITNSAYDLASYRAAIKEAKRELKETKDGESKWKRSAIRLMKHYRDTFCQAGTSMLYSCQGEMNYGSKFLTPLLVELFRHAENIEWQWGDITYDVLKQEEGMAMKDDERRIKGLMPDGVFRLKTYGLIMALIEISGPPNTKDNKHFVNDKIKIAKLLKKLLKNILGQLKLQGDHDIYQCVKVYGLQFYNHKLYAYSLSQPEHGVYVFQEELRFNLACHIGFLPNFAPRCLRNLYKAQSMILESAQSIEEYLNTDHMGNSSDDSSDSRDSNYISPRHKKCRKNADQ